MTLPYSRDGEPFSVFDDCVSRPARFNTGTNIPNISRAVDQLDRQEIFRGTDLKAGGSKNR